MRLLLRSVVGAFTVVALMLGAAGPAAAQAKATLADTKAARALTDAIMARIASGDLEGGLRMMQPYLVIPAADLETTIDQAKSQAPVMAQRFGKTIGSEFLRQDRAGERLLRIQQLQYFEQHATRWSFYFYRTPRGWALNTFVLSDDIKTFF